MRLKKNIAISESGFIFNPLTGDSFSANSVGLKVLELLKSENSGEEIKQKLHDTFEVSPRRLEEDLSDFFDYLRQLNLLQEDEI